MLDDTDRPVPRSLLICESDAVGVVLARIVADEHFRELVEEVLGYPVERPREMLLGVVRHHEDSDLRRTHAHRSRPGCYPAGRPLA